MLQKHSFIVCDSMLVAVVHKINHHKTTSSTYFTSSLHYCGLVKGGGIWIDSKNRVAPIQILQVTKNHYLAFCQVENFKKRKISMSVTKERVLIASFSSH